MSSLFSRRRFTNLEIVFPRKAEGAISGELSSVGSYDDFVRPISRLYPPFGVCRLRAE